jgi:hypothetical protein
MHSRARPLWSGLNGDLKSRLGAAGIRCKRPQWVERPPSRLFGRLPPCIPSRLRLAGIRKPLTFPAVCGTAIEPQGSTQTGSSSYPHLAPEAVVCPSFSPRMLPGFFMGKK